jgi:glycerate kinase
VRVVIAPDSFKGSIAARDAAEAIAAGWRSVRPADDILLLPQADGGEGTLDAIEAATPDAVRRSAGTVTGPDGRPVPGEWLELPDGTAVVELAQMSGITLMASLDPLGATTRGLGEVIAAALESGAVELVIALGGSASTDGGKGALEALDLSRPPSRGVRLLTDVTAPLLGPTGAAALFGPQKGATAEQVAELEERLVVFSSLYDTDPTTPGAGAAGGTAFGFLAAWNAVIQPGAPEIAGLTGLSRHLHPGGVLITGEGSFDVTSTQGKVVGHAIQLAAEAGVDRTFVIAGQFVAEPYAPAGIPVTSISLADLAGSTAAALADPAQWLTVAGARAAAQLEA